MCALVSGFQLDVRWLGSARLIPLLHHNWLAPLSDSFSIGQLVENDKPHEIPLPKSGHVSKMQESLACR